MKKNTARPGKVWKWLMLSAVAAVVPGVLGWLYLRPGGRSTAPGQFSSASSSGRKQTEPVRTESPGPPPGEDVTDEKLRALRASGMLHTLPGVGTEAGGRPTRPEEVTSLDLNGTAVTDEGLKELVGLKNLTTLTLPQTNNFRPLQGRVTSAGLKHLAGLKKLTTLNLVNSSVPVTDETLRVLREAGLLHALELAEAKLWRGPVRGRRPARPEEVTELTLRNMERVTNEGLKELAGLKNLTSLNLWSTSVTDAGLKELAGLKNLTSLNLGGTKVKGPGLMHLAGLKNLSSLDLLPQQVTDAALGALRDAGRLHALTIFPVGGAVFPLGAERGTRPEDVVGFGLSNTKVTDDGLKELAVLKNLSSLGLSHTEVTGAGLKHLAGLKKLTHLSLDGKQVTDETLRTLREVGLLHALPGVRLVGGVRPTKPEEVSELDLSNTKVTDEGLKELAVLKNLSSLDLADTKVKGPGLKHLAGLRIRPGITSRFTGFAGARGSSTSGGGRRRGSSWCL